MLDDARLERLLRDAKALRDAERPVAGVIRPRWRGAVALAAAIALLAAGVVILWAARPGMPAAPIEIVKGPKAGPDAQSPVGAAGAVGAVVMAIAESAGGELECVGWTQVSGGPAGDAWTPETLRAMGSAVACNETAVKLLVVGLSGPRSQLPSSDAQASEVARCFLRLPPCAGSGADTSRCEAVGGGCLGNGVAVRVEVVARW